MIVTLTPQEIIKHSCTYPQQVPKVPDELLISQKNEKALEKELKEEVQEELQE